MVDSVAVGQQYEGDERIVLFVILEDNVSLDDALQKKIKIEIRDRCSPRHVPALLIQTSAIPYTLNGKKVELAIKKLIHGQAVKNKDSLSNPESLVFYETLQLA